MIHRQYVTCDVCGTHHTLRIQMGYGAEQSHRFLCHGCNEPITIELPSEKNGGRMVLTGATITEESDSTEYQYLSPDFVADKEKARNPLYFGAFELMDRLHDAAGDDAVLTAMAPGAQWIALTDAPSDWQILQRSWRLARAGNHYLAAAQLPQLSARDDEMAITTWPAVLEFTDRLFWTDRGLMESVLEIRRQHPREFSRLVMTYEYEWKGALREGQFQVFGEFFKRWGAVSQVYLYVQAGIDLPAKPVATSVNYEDVRGFYALAQEFYASQIVLLTSLHNIKAGRPFDKLQNISLEKYRTTDNAKRRDNFVSDPIFAMVSSEFDNGLRNAEAHNWISLQPNGHILSYKQGGSGAEVRLEYVLYLFKCMRLFKQICLLMQIEYLLVQAAQANARQLLQTSSGRE
jgi:hypothetical protein